MVARDEVYERKLKCVFNIDKNGVTKRPPFNRSHSLGFKEPSNNPAQTAKKQSSRNGSITRSMAFCAMYRFDFLEFSIVFFAHNHNFFLHSSRENQGVHATNM